MLVSLRRTGRIYKAYSKASRLRTRSKWGGLGLGLTHVYHLTGKFSVGVHERIMYIAMSTGHVHSILAMLVSISGNVCFEIIIERYKNISKMLCW